MKILLGSKKVPLPNIKIYDYVPYTIVPKDVTDPFILFTNPKKLEKYKGCNKCKRQSLQENFQKKQRKIEPLLFVCMIRKILVIIS